MEVLSHSLASFNCFTFKIAPTFYQKWFLKTRYIVLIIRFCSNFTSMWYKFFLRNVWRYLRLQMSTSATVTRKRFQNYCINWCFDRVSYVTIADADIGSLKSLHALLNK